MSKKQYFELLENKSKVKKEILEDNTNVETIPEEFTIIESPFVEPVKLEESLLQDLLQSENEQKPAENPPQTTSSQTTSSQTTSQPKIEKSSKPSQPLQQPTQQRKKREKKPEDIEHLEILTKKQELLVKFDILRKNTDRYIPQYTMNHNYSVMKNHYHLLVKQLQLDSKVMSYKQMLLGASGYMEIFLGNFVGLDMEGFTKHQADNIHVYDKILTKLGEKSYTPLKFIESFPLEVQLLLMIGFQSLMFIITKSFPIAQMFQQNK